MKENGFFYLKIFFLNKRNAAVKRIKLTITPIPAAIPITPPIDKVAKKDLDKNIHSELQDLVGGVPGLGFGSGSGLGLGSGSGLGSGLGLGLGLHSSWSFFVKSFKHILQVVPSSWHKAQLSTRHSLQVISYFSLNKNTCTGPIIFVIICS